MPRSILEAFALDVRGQIKDWANCNVSKFLFLISFMLGELTTVLIRSQVKNGENRLGENTCNSVYSISKLSKCHTINMRHLYNETSTLGK